MLKMKCPNCEKELTSPLLAEIETIACKHCQETVPVKDVIVSAKGYSYHRNDLIKRLFRYKSLISEVTKELEMLEKSPESSPQSKKSLDRFLATLEEMMAGARDHLRIEFKQALPVTYKSKRGLGTGRLANLSMDGACLETEKDSTLPRNGTDLAISFALPGERQPVTLNGKVAWLKKTTNDKNHSPQIGIKFTPLDPDVHATLWAFISNSATGPKKH